MTDDTDTCQVCNGRGLIECPAHGIELDPDGWCDPCSTPMDGGPAGVVWCECQQD